MTAPKFDILQMEHQNSMASAPLFLPVMVLPNTPDDEIRRNIRINSALDLEWIQAKDAHDGIAVMVGGGGSLKDFPETIKEINGTVFAMNGASKWCGKHGIQVDYQCILDAKEETVSLIDYNARHHLIASQANPKTMAAIDDPIVWHCNTGNIEQDFPPEKIARGGYCLPSGGSACGNSALYAAYAMGYRAFHVFGYDSCHQDTMSHAYDQPMNDRIPVTQVVWGDRTFRASVAMKGQAEDFQITNQMLKHVGCTFEVYGDGLLQAMYSTKPENMTERDKYKTLWQFENYRASSPGLRSVPEFIAQCAPDKDDIIIDFGCGSGKASVELSRLGYNVFLTDFADNCRDEEAISLPFLEWDLTKPIPASAPFGLCCDVMEHIPPDDVDTVLTNIMTSAETVFFQICTIDDDFGELMYDEPLHLTVIPGETWIGIFESLGYTVAWYDIGATECRLVVTTQEN